MVKIIIFTSKGKKIVKPMETVFDEPKDEEIEEDPEVPDMDDFESD